MDILFIALIFMIIVASSLLFIALLPKFVEYNILANRIGALGVVVFCAMGLAYLISDMHSGVLELKIPWGLYYGTGSVGIDNLSRFFLFPIFALGGICAIVGCINMPLYSANYYNVAAHWLFYAMLLIGMTFVVIARDAVLFIFAWELMSISSFFLINFYNKKPKVRESSWIYLVASHLSLLFVFILFALLWGESGYTTFSSFALMPSTTLASIVFIFAIIAFGLKAGIVPLHIWLPIAHPIAPSHISAILSSVMINIGLYGLMRTFTFFDILSNIPTWWGWLLLFIGVLSALIGILKALVQKDLKCLLAYSSTENMGIMFMGVGVGLIGLSANNNYITILGFTATIFHMLNHSIFKGLLFLCVGEIFNATKTVHLNKLGGLQKKLPALGIFFALGVVAIICLPPLNGFSSEFLLYFSLITSLDILSLEGQLVFLCIIATLSLISALSLGTFAKAYGLAFLGEPRTTEADNPIAYDKFINYILGILAFLCLLMGLLAPFIFKGIVTLLSSFEKFFPKHSIDFRMNTGEVEIILYNIVVIGIACILLCCFFYVLRKCLNKRNGLRLASTWSCGFQAATSRIQYRSASFVEPSTSFFSVFSGVKFKLYMHKDYFPAKANFRYKVNHRLLLYVVVPCFEYIVGISNKLKIIQHGKIHIYILYMFATLLCLLIWGLWT